MNVSKVSWLLSLEPLITVTGGSPDVRPGSGFVSAAMAEKWRLHVAW